MRRIGLVLAFVVAIVGLGQSAASADTTVRIENRGNGQCLDGYGNTPYLYSCTPGNSYQS